MRYSVFRLLGYQDLKDQDSGVGFLDDLAQAEIFVAGQSPESTPGIPPESQTNLSIV